MLLLQKLIHRQDLRENRKVLYLFGDNEMRRGLGGQAGAMRGEPNAHGIATLLAPGRFWSDADAERQCRVLNQDFARPLAALSHGEIVVYPMDGVGTGLSQLEKESPLTFAYLKELVAKMETYS